MGSYMDLPRVPSTVRQNPAIGAAEKVLTIPQRVLCQPSACLARLEIE